MQHRRLRQDSMGLAHSVVLGVAGTAPSFSIAASGAILIAATGGFAPAIVLYCGLTMLGITMAFARLNHDDPNAGASFIWVSRIFGPTLGFLAGWCVLVTSVLFMASATLPAASATLLLLAPEWEKSPTAVTLVALAWLLAVSAVTLRGTAVTARIQSTMIAIELLVLAIIGIASLMQLGPHTVRPFDWSSFSLSGLEAKDFINGSLISLFLFWGWDISLNMSEETRSGHRASSLGAVLAMVILIVVFTLFYALALTALEDAEIEAAGTQLIFAIADALFPRPCPRAEDLDELLTRAAERGAERALACLGLENGHAAADIRDLRGLIDAWRDARRTAWQTAVKVVTTGVLAALLVGVAIKLKLMGGVQ